MRTTHGMVHLVHESARDYLLLEDGMDTTAFGPFRREARSAHLRAVCACLARILQCGTARTDSPWHLICGSVLTICLQVLARTRT